MKKLILLLAIISFVLYPQTQIRENQIKDRSITRNKLNSDSIGRAVIKKIFAISPLAITSTGVDTGTGDVTVKFESTYIPYYLLYGEISDERMDSLRTFIIDTTSLSNRINTKLTASDTTAFRTFSNNKYLGIDSNLNADMLDSLHASDFSSVYHTHSGTYCRWRGVASSDPSTPLDGDLYYNSVTTTVYLYADSRWINLIP